MDVLGSTERPPDAIEHRRLAGAVLAADGDDVAARGDLDRDQLFYVRTLELNNFNLRSPLFG